MAEDDWDAAAPLQNLSLSEEPAPQQQPVPSDVAFSAHVAAVHDAPIDPTLVDALGNPRERMNVLKFEDIIASFVQSRDDVLETPPLSSYHRLLVYRLAARFQLEHAKSETMCMEPDRHAICLYKTTNTCFPKTLLIHMAQSTPAGESATAPQPQPTKIKLMKRNTSDSNRPVRSDKESQSRSNISMTDRERQYAEARARIFGTSSPTPSSDAKEEADRTSSESAPAIMRDRSRSPASTEGDDRSAEAPTSVGAVTGAGVSGTKGPRRKVVNPGTWQGKKGVLRDKEAEKNDPDFRRHHHPPAYRNPSPAYAPYGAAMDPHMGRSDGSWIPPAQHAHVPYGAGMHYPVYGMDAYQPYYPQGYQQHAQVPRQPPPSAYDYNQEFPPLK